MVKKFKSQMLDDFDYHRKMRVRKGLLESLTFLPKPLTFAIGVFCRNVVEPCKRGYFQYRRFYSFLEKSQWWSREELKEYQKNRLRALLYYAYNNVPYYREIFKKIKLTPDDFKSVNDLAKLPILTKEDVVNNLDKLISRKVKEKNLILNYTSGSTGKPMFFYLDQKARFIYWGFLVWALKLSNVNISDRHIRMWSRPFIEKNINEIYLYDPYQRRLSLSMLPTHTEKLEEYLRLIKRFKPIYIIGSPSFFYRLAGYAQETGNVSVNFRVLFSNYENLYPFQRNLIQAQFHCEIFNNYSSEENVIYAIECKKHEGLHIDIRYGIMEIVDENGELLDNEQQGRIICTGLHNYAMPLLRYDMTDVGSISNKQCSCGRGLPLLNSLDGRASEIIKYKNKTIYPATLSVILERFKNIKECQFIQDKENKIKMNIVIRKGYSPKDSEKLLEVMRHLIDEQVDLEINFSDNIPRTKMGKFQFVINHLNRNN